jgi:hypothetical protein
MVMHPNDIIVVSDLHRQKLRDFVIRDRRAALVARPRLAGLLAQLPWLPQEPFGARHLATHRKIPEFRHGLPSLWQTC